MATRPSYSNSYAGHLPPGHVPPAERLDRVHPHHDLLFRYKELRDHLAASRKELGAAAVVVSSIITSAAAAGDKISS
jgi:hypothetical protein